MANDGKLAIFANFNDITEAPPPVAAGPSPGELADIRSLAWTEGFLTGQRGSAGTGVSSPGSLLTAVHALEATAGKASETAALTMAGLFVQALLTATDETWTATLGERVRNVARRIKPVLTSQLRYMLHAGNGSEHEFEDISALCRALDDGSPGGDVTIRWHQGEAFIGKQAFLHDLRDAFEPLLSSRSNPQ
jgi:hypothetical protein